MAAGDSRARRVRDGDVHKWMNCLILGKK
jgi:hypothetical protein